MHRYAIYFAPARTHPLWTAGCAILGHDPETGEALPRPVLGGVSSDRLVTITAEARRYGWHATLKPPFSLASGTDVALLEAALDRFSARCQRFRMPALTLAPLSGFLAVVPAEPSEALDQLAAACVRDFDHFRAPPSETELAKQRRGGLDAVEDANLASWGYPYVMDRFRFHMTLTTRLDAPERDAIAAALRPYLADALATPLLADAISLYGEPAQGEAFRLLRRYPFGA